MAQPLYRKFGVGAVDFDPLVKGQAAVGEHLKSAVKNVQGLLAEQEKQAVEENTLNMEAHLKTQMKQAGLRGLRENPINTTAIQQKFGDLIDMDRINSSIESETKRMTGEAVNAATAAGLQALKENDGDVVAATQRFKDVMNQAGADQKVISLSTQAFVDGNAVAIDNAKKLKIRSDNERDASILREIRETGGNIEAIKTFYKEKLDPDEYVKGSKRIDDLVESSMKMSEEDQYQLTHYTTRFADETDLKLQPYREVVQNLTGKLKSLTEKGPISQASIDGAHAISSKLGGSVAGEIGDWGTNLIEQFHSVNDAKAVQGIYEDLIRANVRSEDAGAILFQAFGDAEKDTGFLGNDVDDDKIEWLRDRALTIAGTVAETAGLSSQLTAAQQDLARREKEAEMSVKDFTDKLRTNLRRENIGTPDAVPAEKFASNYLSTSISQRREDAPGEKPGAGAGAVDTSSPLYYLSEGGKLNPPPKGEPAAGETMSAHQPREQVQADQPKPTAFGTGELTDNATVTKLNQERQKQERTDAQRIDSIRRSAKLPSKEQQAVDRIRNTAVRKSGGRPNLSAAPTTVVLDNQTRKGGSKSWRNNNPGNLRWSKGDTFAKKNGAKGVDQDGFAVFPDADTGRRALEKWLFKKHGVRKLSDALEIYAPNNENDTARYIQVVLDAVGGTEKRLQDYSPQEQAAIVQAMIKHEGWKEGEVIDG